MAKVLNYARVRRIPEGAVYIGRAMKGIPENPLFKNPFKMHSESQRELCVSNTSNTYGNKYRQVL